MKVITNLHTPKKDCDSESTDDEQNSHGSNCSEDYVFDIVSQSTEETESEESICIMSNIVDCCTFSNENLYLTKNYEIYANQRKIVCNRKLIKIFSYNQCLYGLDKYGCIYSLSTYYHSSDYWVFTKVDWLPQHVKEVSVTLDGQYLWVQTASKCYLFKDEKSNMYHCSNKRIYGKDKNHYLELNDHDCEVYINDRKIKTIPNVINAVLDHYNNVHVVTLTDPYKQEPKARFQQVRIVNHKPYYF